jgi:heme/copper-type cytochrome/quinol oxidase subunit 3
VERVELNKLSAALEREPVIPSAVLGMLLFVFSEAMMFSGLISAVTIARATALIWPPVNEVPLPVAATAFNSAVLLASGLLLFFAARAYQGNRPYARGLLLFSMLTGAFFVCFQGYEWVELLRQGLTLRSSLQGGYFYLIVGVHALHAVAGLSVLVVAYLRLRRAVLQPSFLAATQVFWYFVVALWPFLYVRVYL